VRFGYNAFGKPDLSPELGRLKFSLSHSADLALIAIAADAEIGVDLELIREQSDWAEIARCFFSAAERDRLNRLPPLPPGLFRLLDKKGGLRESSGRGPRDTVDEFFRPPDQRPCARSSRP
jgi:4'-phosphopantetheinyl transferase